MNAKAITKPRNLRQKIWQVLRENRAVFLTVEEIGERSGAGRMTAYAYLSALRSAGFVSQQKAMFEWRDGWRLERDAGLDVPRLHADGTPAPCTATEAMWRTMKILQTFTIDILLEHVKMTHEVSRATVKGYTLALERAGYLNNTGGARKKRFVLTRNTGAKPPQVLAVKEVYDPNLDEIVLREVPDYE